jgi:hypothetical protein
MSTFSPFCVKRWSLQYLLFKHIKYNSIHEEKRLWEEAKDNGQRERGADQRESQGGVGPAAFPSAGKTSGMGLTRAFFLLTNTVASRPKFRPHKCKKGLKISILNRYFLDRKGRKFLLPLNLHRNRFNVQLRNIPCLLLF